MVHMVLLQFTIATDCCTLDNAQLQLLYCCTTSRVCNVSLMNCSDYGTKLN